MKFTRLFGGTAAAALAATARQVVDDEDISPAANAGAAGPDDEEEADEEEASPAAAQPNATPVAAAPTPASPPAPAPAAGAAPETEGEPLNLTAEQRQYFDMGAAAGVIGRNAEIAEVFNARAAGENGAQGELVVAGREAAAAELLAEGLSAQATIKTLGKLPKGGGDGMLRNLAATPNPAIDPGGEQEAAAAENHGWGKAHAKVRQVHGRRSSK